nr:RNA-directed DNA polymerase, eukaryota, reverse transcriptase zinc-binding domain protein [Tanacetum cinerariifolium]
MKGKESVMDESEIRQESNIKEAGTKGTKVCYVNIVNSNGFDNKLNLILIEINEEGIEVVIFDEEIVSEGSKKWELTMCGYFMGYKMSYQELRYNLFRMWGKFRLRSIIPNGNGVFLFKFRSSEGIQSDIEKGPRMMNGKPMFVQKWEPSVNLDKNEPNKLPLWVKLRNLPLKAWTTK